MKDKEKKNVNKIKRKYPVLYTLIILVLGIFIGEVSSYYFLVFYAPKHKNQIPIIEVSKKDKLESISTDSYVVNLLLNRFHYNDGTNNDRYLYYDDNINLDKLPDEYINTVIINEAIRESVDKEKKFSVKDLENARDTLFGNRNLHLISTTDDFGVCPKYNYNELDKKYLESSDSSCDYYSDLNIKRSVIKALKSNDELYIYEVVAFIKDNLVYKNISSSGEVSYLLDDVKVDDTLDDNIEKLNTFKYTFKYNDKTDNYEFREISKVSYKEAK